MIEPQYLADQVQRGFGGKLPPNTTSIRTHIFATALGVWS